MSHFRSYELLLRFLVATAFWWAVSLAYPQAAPNQVPSHHTTSPEPSDEVVASYTLALAVFTGVLAFSTIGLWIVTWRSGIKQSGDMQQAINASIASNHISVTNAEHQLRAYVTVQEISLTIHRHPDRIGTYDGSRIPSAPHTYRFAVTLKNGGMTPAVNGRINISCQKFNGQIPADFSFPDSDSFGNALIGPQTTWHSPSVTVSAAEFENPAVPAERYLWGWVEYDDIFPGTLRHRTEFCFQIIFERLQPTNEPWIRFEPYSRFNAADHGCMRPIDPHSNRSA